MDALRDTDLYTPDEFHDLLVEGQKGDLIEGVIYLASPDTLDADQINRFLLSLVGMYVAAKQLGQVTGSRFAYRLGPHGAPEPDLAFVRRDRVAHVLTRREGIGPPDVVVEVVAKDSRYRDYGAKKRMYEESGVTEYWIIDSIQRRGEFHRLLQGHYEQVPLSDDQIFRSQSIPGFWLDVRWLLGAVTANEWECLQVILGQ